MDASYAKPFARPLYVMLKPVGARCNLACEYCYYLGRGLQGDISDTSGSQDGGLCESEPFGLTVRAVRTGSPNRSDCDGPRMGQWLMTDWLLEEFTRQYLEAQTMDQVLFTWHGGEPLLRPISFYEKALALQRRYAGRRQVDNCLQTNGTLLNDEWCRFLRDNGFLVGISIDGPQWMHDHYRRSATGQPSWERVMRGIELLQRHGVEWNAMATVNDLTARHPQEFYRFFRELGCLFLQFTPVVERVAFRAGTESAPTLRAVTAPFSVTPDDWGCFLCEVYDEWVCRDVGQLFVQTFDATLANWVGEPPGVCSLSAQCGHAAVMEADGTVYSCDHFVSAEHRLGNINEQSLTALLYGERQRLFGRQKTDGLTRQCRECPWLFACHGECPRNRFAQDRYGNPHHNYLCEGYRRFFAHVARDMDFMAEELRQGRAPANVMTIYNKQ